ncbi:hypothetical protein [Leucobacter salsicius]|uniref:hypothetical protein n=1 Tax=Leucobacter salsicius TaxID=664638 RepID=UPI00034A2F49|nr:hypothetical protein [Leucobacter salsicius]
MATTSTTKTKKATAAKEPADTAATTEVSEYDFDGWTQEAEDAALIQMSDVKYIIVEGNFIGRFGDGTIVKIPLSIKLSMIDELQADFDTPIDQFRHLLRTFAGEEVADDLSDRSIVPVAVMSEKFFRALSRAQELAFPESKASSN